MVFSGVHMKKLLLVLTVLALTSSIHAQESYHDRLSKGEVIVETAEVVGSSIPEATVTAVIDVPPSDVWRIIEKCNDYPKNMVSIRKAVELSRAGSVVVCEVTTAMPWPISDLTAKTRAKHTVGPPVWSREWNLIEGDYESNEGSWRIQSFNLENTRSLVVYRLHAVPKLSLPDVLIKYAQRQVLPDLMEHIRERVKK